MKKDYVLIGNVKLGKNVKIENGVKVYGPVTIGNNTYIGSNSIIGFPMLENLKSCIKGVSEKKFETIIGDNCMIYSNVNIYENVKIGDNVNVFHNALIREETVIGDNCIIGTNSVLDGYIKIGKNVLIHSSSYICSHSKIGNQVFIGPGVKFANEKTAKSRISLKEKMPKFKGPIIEEKVCVGAGAIILPAIRLRRESFIGAGAVVTKDTKPNMVYTGIPAKKLKERDF